MKSQVVEDRYFIECGCHSPSHLLVVDMYEDEDYLWPADMMFVSNFKESWYKRIWLALKYIFVHDPFLMSDSVCISERNIKQFEELIKRFKKIKNKPEK